MNKKKYLIMGIINIALDFWILAVRGVSLESILYCLCTSALLVVGVTDWQTYEIPMGCNLFIGALGLIRLLTDLANLKEYLLGFVLVSGILLLVYFLTKGEGIGGGDIKLMAAAGLLLGGLGILLAFLLGSIAGSVIHLSLMKLKGKGRKLAFGPYLAFGIFCAMLYGENIIDWYLAFCGF